MEKFQLAYKFTDILKNQRINFDFLIKKNIFTMHSANYSRTKFRIKYLNFNCHLFTFI
jgi:hypothetical protein